MASEPVRSEVQVLRLASTAVSVANDTLTGNFRLSWGDGGEETDYLPADVGEVGLEAALEGLQDVRDVQVCVHSVFIVPFSVSPPGQVAIFFFFCENEQTFVARRISFFECLGVGVNLVTYTSESKDGLRHRTFHITYPFNGRLEQRLASSHAKTLPTLLLTGFPRSKHRFRVRLVRDVPDRRRAVRVFEPVGGFLQRIGRCSRCRHYGGGS